MTLPNEKRSIPRLKLRYPIRIQSAEESGAAETAPHRTLTHNLGARGAYFSTFPAEAFRIGQQVSVVLTVPHRLADGGQEVLLDLTGRGRVVRVERPEMHRVYGEDGTTLVGVAVEFSGPLTFQYRWI